MRLLEEIHNRPQLPSNMKCAPNRNMTKTRELVRICSRTLPRKQMLINTEASLGDRTAYDDLNQSSA